MNGRAQRGSGGAGPEDLWVTLGFFVLGAALALSGLVWAAGQLAGGLLGAGRPSAGLTESGRVLARLVRDPGDPVGAWPPADRALLPGRAALWATLAALLVLLGIVLYLVLRLRAGSSAGGREPRSARGRRGAARAPEGHEHPRDLGELGYSGPAIDVVPGPARWLVGLAGGRRPLWARPDTNLLVLGPARSRKSSGVLLPNIRRWPGGMVITSTRPEVLEWALAARDPDDPACPWRGRPFAVFDPAGLLDSPHAASWWPWIEAARWDRAVSVAQAMASGLEDAGTTNSRHFADLAGQLLAPILHGAALQQASLAQVRAWVAGSDTATLLAFLRERGSATAAQDLAAYYRMPDDAGGGKAAITSTARRALGWSARDEVRAALDPLEHPELDLERLIVSGGTLVIVSPSHRMRELAPLVSALLASLVETGQELAFRSRSRRLEPPFAFLLDEVANIAPFDALPELMATGGGSGMPTLAVAQDLAQLAERWGPERSQTIWDNAAVRLITPGSTDQRTEEAAIRAAGELLAVRHSGGDSRGRSGPGMGAQSANQSRNEGWSEGWEPVLRKGELGRMTLGDALCIASGARPVVVGLVGERPTDAAPGRGPGSRPGHHRVGS